MDLMNISTVTSANTDIGALPDRRGTGRFSVREEVRYRVVDKLAKVSGSGVTLNFGSGGILFTTRETLPVGRTVELSVNWPVRVGARALQFVATGRVVRSEDDTAAVRIERYEFKTRNVNGLSEIASQPAGSYESRCTVSMENAGTHTAMYSAPSASGVL
jgi:hypothetical protein